MRRKHLTARAASCDDANLYPAWTTLGGLFFFGAIGLLVGPLIGALLMASWAVYREAFADELGLNDHTDPPQSGVTEG